MNKYGRVTDAGGILYVGPCLQKGGMQGGCELQGQQGLNNYRMRELGGSGAELSEDSVISFSRGNSVSVVSLPFIIVPSP